MLSLSVRTLSPILLLREAALSVFFPGGPELLGNNPEQFVEQIEPWPWMSTFQNAELLPQGEILQYKFPTVTKKANEYSEPEQKQAVHEPGL